MKFFKIFKLLLVLIVFFILIGTASVMFLLRPGSSQRNTPNVILISIDTCRADYLSCYGYPHKTTPNIDQVAQESVLFTNVITPIPLTRPAHISMLTGTLPPYHRIRDHHHRQLAPSHLTLAEILRSNGFTTGAIISSFVLDSQFGLNQGFDTYNDRFEEIRRNVTGNERSGGEASRFALEWLEKHKEKNFFLFLHYYDPHTDYEPPEPFASEFADNLYAGEIAYTDHCISQVIKRLKELNLYDSSLIIITSDHGEMLGEHGEEDHCYFIYQSSIKVPLIFKLPGQTKVGKVDHLVGLIDIVPTVCRMLDIEPPPEVQGKDLSSYFQEKQSFNPERHLYCESLWPTRYDANPLIGVVTDRWKYIQTTRPELYDLIDDPEETNNLVTQQPQRANRLRESLKQILEQITHKDDSTKKLELDEEALERLASLGYIGGHVSEDLEIDPDKEDPKDLIEFHTSLMEAYRFLFLDKHDQAKLICHEILSKRPQFYEANLLLARLAMNTKKWQEAAEHFNTILQINPKHVESYRNRYIVKAKLGNLPGAIADLSTAIGLDPTRSMDWLHRGDLRHAQKDWTGALSDYNEAIRIDPQNVMALRNRSDLLFQQGKLQDALADLNVALQLKPKVPELWYRRALVRQQLGDLSGAFLDATECLNMLPPKSPNRPRVAQLLSEIRAKHNS